SFFLYFYGALPDLHSFPTRRSSDLCEGRFLCSNGNFTFSSQYQRCRENRRTDHHWSRYFHAKKQYKQNKNEQVLLRISRSKSNWYDRRRSIICFRQIFG